MCSMRLTQAPERTGGRLRRVGTPGHVRAELADAHSHALAQSDASSPRLRRGAKQPKSPREIDETDRRGG